jgi:hypothetical protein
MSADNPPIATREIRVALLHHPNTTDSFDNTAGSTHML